MPAQRNRHPFFARLYVRISPAAERAGSAEHRDRLLTGLSGRIIEIGCGNGLNFAHYPEGVTEVIAVEPEPFLRKEAVMAAKHSAVPVRVIEGRAETLPAPDASFDAAVISLVLCSIDNPLQALAEIHRVLGPAGELRFYEHVAAATDPLRRYQRLLSPLWQRVGGGCHIDQDSEALIEAAGFTIGQIDHFDFQPGPAFPVALVRPHILGAAHLR
ncbi:MAG TPA: class I SAM-dependent methyltransferase [Acidimicrobiales bacterium]|nr:class I SAM-dependent methyltransferase [Acidimicrobiales bacterium]